MTLPRDLDANTGNGDGPREWVEELRSRLGPDGWTVELDERYPGRLHVSFSHELTCTHSCGFGRKLPVSRQQFEEMIMLLEPEFEVIAERPAVVEHPRLIKSIRQAAGGLRWPSTVVEVIGGILISHEVLGVEEGEWLMSAGASWQFDDEQDVRDDQEQVDVKDGAE